MASDIPTLDISHQPPHIPVDVIPPGDPDHPYLYGDPDDPDARHHHVLTIGQPDGMAALGLGGPLPQLREFGAQLCAYLAAASLASTLAPVEHLYIHAITAARYDALHQHLGLPHRHLGPWNGPDPNGWAYVHITPAHAGLTLTDLTSYLHDHAIAHTAVTITATNHRTPRAA